MAIQGIIGALAAGGRVIGGGARSFGTSIGSSMVGSITSPLWSAASRESTYASNRIGPTMVPEKDGLLKLWWTSRINAEDMARGLSNQGVYWRQDALRLGKWPSVWWDLIDLEKPMWSVEDYRRWFRLGIINQPQFEAAMARAGFSPDDYAANDFGRNGRNYTLFRDDYELPPFGVVIDLWHRGVLTEADTRRYLKGMGLSDADIERFVNEYDQPLDLTILYQLRNREIIGPASFDAYLQKLGIRTQLDRDQVEKLRFLLPGPSDLVSFALKEAWDPGTVDRFQYDAEYPAEFQHWMSQQGANADARTPDQVQQGFAPVSWSQLYWRVHWQNVSPQQAYEMYHRLRADRLAHFGPDFAGMRAFTFADLQQVLKVNDYPVPFRQQLAAISSQVLTRVDIARMYQLRIIDRAEVLAQYLDRGYTPADAENLTRFVETTDRVRRSNRFIRKTKAQVIEAYQLGMLSRTSAAIALYELQFEDPTKLAEFRALPQGDREFTATQDPAVRIELENVDFERRLGNTRSIVNIIRKLYYQAALKDDETYNRLTAAGIQGSRATEFIQQWMIERQGPRKLLTARNIVTAVGTGVLSYAIGYARLVLLGYLPDDARTLLAQATRSLATSQAKAQQAAAKSVAQQQRAAQATIKALAAEQKAAQSELARYGTPKNLVDWYAKGYIPYGLLTQRLNVILADQVKVDSYLAEATAARDARLAAST